jgi:hypothetical protein
MQMKEPQTEAERKILTAIELLRDTHPQHAKTAQQCVEAAQLLRVIYLGLINAANMAVRLQSPQKNELKADDRRLQTVRKALQAAQNLPTPHKECQGPPTAEALALMEKSAGKGFEDAAK